MDSKVGDEPIEERDVASKSQRLSVCFGRVPMMGGSPVASSQYQRAVVVDVTL